MPVYTAELYPTAIRNAGVGACNASAGIALIIVPYLSLLVGYYSFILSPITKKYITYISLQNKIQPHYLMCLLTASSFLGSIVVIFLPESMEKPAATKDDEET